MSWILYAQHANDVRRRLQEQGLMHTPKRDFLGGRYWPDASLLLRRTVEEWCAVLGCGLGPQGPSWADITRIGEQAGIGTKDRDIETMKPEQIIFTGFVVAATAYGVYRLLAPPRETRTDHGRRETQPSPRAADPAPPQTSVLILAVPVSRNEQLLDGIEREGLQTEHVEDLLRTTRAVWAGSEAAFSESPLARHFGEGGAHRSAPDDRDVRLLRLRIRDFPAGFRQGGLLLDRIDTLRRLAQGGVQVRLSPRLPISALDGAGMHN